MMKRETFFFIYVITLAFCFSHCGYRLAGTAIIVPDHVQTVHIQKFSNGTQFFEVGDFVQSAIEREFLRKSRMKKVNDRTAGDSVLEGEIIAFSVTPKFETEKASDKSYLFSIMMRLVWVDTKNNEIIYDGESLSYNDVIKMDSDDFFSQDSDLIEDAAKKFASSVVSLLFENF